MPRTARIVVPGSPHHITQRGNNRQDVFFVDDDRRFYLRTLARQADRFGLEVLGYCLMTNHVHLIAVPRESESLARAVGSTNLIHARYINRLHDRSGHLWQNRFFSCPLDAGHLLAAMRYVERNPVRAHLLRAPWRYRWSSAAAHCGDADDPFELLDLSAWRRRWSPEDWRAILRDRDDPDLIDTFRRSTLTGRPLGGDRFIAKLETKLNRRLRARPVGRPRGSKKKAVKK
jgi:putative transposase